MLRFDFPGGSSDLAHISWDDRFRSFEERDLVFMFQEHTKDVNDSNFFRLDNPERSDG